MLPTVIVEGGMKTAPRHGIPDERARQRELLDERLLKVRSAELPASTAGNEATWLRSTRQLPSTPAVRQSPSAT